MTLSRFASLAAIALALSACDVGTFGMSMGGGIDDTVCKDRLATPAAAHTHTTGMVPGTAKASNAGESCVVASCHLPSALGAGANPYQYGGTLYSDAGGTTPQAGAWVRVNDGQGTVIESASDADGNFWFEGSNMLAAPFPSQTSAAVCGTSKPGVSKMTSLLVTGGASCNQGGACHGTPTGGTAGTTKLYIIN